MYNLTFMRYARVNQVIRADRALAERLSKPTVWVGKPNQKGEYFAPEIVGIAEELSKSADVNHIPRAEIINFACDVLVLRTKKLNLKDLKTSKPVTMKKEPVFDVRALLDERLEETLKSIEEAEGLLNDLRGQASDLQRAKAALQPGVVRTTIRDRLAKIDDIAEKNGARSKEDKNEFVQKKLEEAEETAENESFQESVNKVAEEEATEESLFHSNVYTFLSLVKNHQTHKHAMGNRYMRAYVVSFFLNTQPPFMTRDSDSRLCCPEPHEAWGSLKKISGIIPLPNINFKSNPEARILGKKNAAKYNREQSAHLTQND